MTILTRKDFEKIFYSKKKSREKEPIQELFRIADGYFKIIEKDLDDLKPVVLFAGLGLTGALAYALAQILFEHKYDTTVVDIYSIYPPIKREIIKKYYGKTIRYNEFKNLKENPNAVYIDAIWGLEYIKGSEGYLDEIYALYNNHSGLKISLEGNSGLNINSGYTTEDYIVSDVTISTYGSKVGFYINQGKDTIKKLVINLPIKE